MKIFRNITVLANPRAGSSRLRQLRQLCEKKLTHYGYVPKVVVPNSADELVQACKDSRKRNDWACVIAGGDGSLNAAIKPLAGGKTRLGLIPSGTGNAFARAMHIPLDAAEALTTIALGRTQMLDIGLVGKDMAFLAVAGCGFEAQVALHSENYRGLGRKSGLLRYIAGGLQAWKSFQAPDLDIQIDGRPLEGKWMQVTLANTHQYGLGITIAPGADPADGKLDMVAVETRSFLNMVIASGGLAFGRKIPRSTQVRFKKAVLKSRNGQKVAFHIDGEAVAFLPQTITVKPGAIRVLVP